MIFVVSLRKVDSGGVGSYGKYYIKCIGAALKQLGGGCDLSRWLLCDDNRGHSGTI